MRQKTVNNQITSQLSHDDRFGLAEKSARGLVANVQTFDDRMVLGWLNSHQMRKAIQGGISQHTLRAYRFETNKFVNFMITSFGHTINEGQYLKLTTEEYAHAYVRVLFESLSPRSIKRALTIINSLFTYVHNTGEIPVQPFSNVGVSLPSTVNTNMDDKALSEYELKLIFDVCEALPRKTKHGVAVYHRTRWLVQLLFRSWQRRAEVANLRMCDFVQTNQGWEIRFVGKGNKLGLVMATPKLMDELATYRQFIGLPPEPSFKEVDVPAVGHAFQPMKRLTEDGVYKAAKRIIFLTIQSIKGDDLEAQRTRLKLAKCAAHTFRHTGISTYMNNGGDLRLAQSQARHASTSSTVIYDQRDRIKWRDDIDRVQSKF